MGVRHSRDRRRGGPIRPARRVRDRTCRANAPAKAVRDIDRAGRDRRVSLYPMLAVSAYFVLFVAAAEGINDFLPELIASNYGDAFTVFGVPVTAESTASSYYSAVLVIAAFAQVGTGALVE